MPQASFSAAAAFNHGVFGDVEPSRYSSFGNNTIPCNDKVACLGTWSSNIADIYPRCRLCPWFLSSCRWWSCQQTSLLLLLLLLHGTNSNLSLGRDTLFVLSCHRAHCLYEICVRSILHGSIVREPRCVSCSCCSCILRSF
jgi:hypothetical protein